MKKLKSKQKDQELKPQDDYSEQEYDHFKNVIEKVLGGNSEEIKSMSDNISKESKNTYYSYNASNSDTQD